MMLALSTLYFGRRKHTYTYRVESLSVLPKYRVENSKCMYWRYRNVLVTERVFSEKGKKKMLEFMCLGKQKNSFVNALTLF